MMAPINIKMNPKTNAMGKTSKAHHPKPDSCPVAFADSDAVVTIERR